MMELMRGGELFDAIAKRGIFTERQAAALIRDVVSVVAKCHAESVIHRDIKAGGAWATHVHSNSAALLHALQS